jgi:hypothetical protein
MLRFSKEFTMKTIALILALAFAAPLAAHAQSTALTSQQQLDQKIQSTYHTSFPNAGN